MVLKSPEVEVRGTNQFNYKDKKTNEVKTMYQIAVEDTTGMPQIIIVDEKAFVKVKKGTKCIFIFEKTDRGTYFRDIELLNK